jgi:hypothetical protein
MWSAAPSPDAICAHFAGGDAVRTFEGTIEAAQVAEPAPERDRRDGSICKTRIQEIMPRPFES